jgi:hypothetical protein
MVEKLSDAAIISEIHAYDSALTITKTHCPDHLDVSQARKATCSIGVDGALLPVIVSYSYSEQRLNANLAGSFFERRVIEKGLEKELQQAGVFTRVHCPMKAVISFPAGTKITCTFQVQTKSRSIFLTTRDNGIIDEALPKDIAKFADKGIQAIIKTHRSGNRTITSGIEMANRINNGLNVWESTVPTKISAGIASCPATLDLTGNNRPTCVIRYGSRKLDYAVWIDSGGLHWQPIEAMIDLQQIQGGAQKMLSVSTTAMTTVVCGSGVVVVAVHSTIRCKVWIGAETHTLVLDVVDVYGHVNMHLN